MDHTEEKPENTPLHSTLLLETDAEIIHFCEIDHPANAANVLTKTEDIPRAAHLFSQITLENKAEIFGHFSLELQAELANYMDRKSLALLISDMSSDERADFFNILPESVQEPLLRHLAHAEREDIRKLTSYDEGTAGAVMSSDYATLAQHLNVSQAIHRLRLEAPDKETIYQSYVINEKRQLLGVVTLRSLIMADPHEKISEIMNPEVISAHVNDDQEDIAHKLSKYDLLALPILSTENTLVGIVTYDDVLDIVQQEQTEDVQRFMAIQTEEGPTLTYLATPSVVHFKRRIFWVVLLAIAGIASGMVIHLFEATLTQLMILAFYIPMITAAGGNTGSQSATVILRSIVLKEVSQNDIFKVLFKELKVALMIAMILAVLAFIKVILLSGTTIIPEPFTLFQVASVISLALSTQVIASTLFGAILPLIAAHLKFDPAIVASPALATIVDITGLIIYFLLAKFLLGI